MRIKVTKIKRLEGETKFMFGEPTYKSTIDEYSTYYLTDKEVKLLKRLELL